MLSVGDSILRIEDQQWSASGTNRSFSPGMRPPAAARPAHCGKRCSLGFAERGPTDSPASLHRASGRASRGNGGPPDRGVLRRRRMRNAGTFVGPPRRGSVGIMLVWAEVVFTVTGRLTTPFPRLDFGTERKASNTVKRVDAWLLDNAVSEALARGNDTVARALSAHRRKPTQADKDSAELILFDDAPLSASTTQRRGSVWIAQTTRRPPASASSSASPERCS